MSLYNKLISRPATFQKITGITPQSFRVIVPQLQRIWKRKIDKQKEKTGRPYRLGNVENQLLCLLLYYRTYTTQLFLGFWFGADAATVCRTIKRLEPLLASVISIKKARHSSQESLEKILIDCTEQPIQRPTRHQKKYYSGKKKRHTLKTEIQITSKGRIINISKPAPGSQHDFAIRKKHDPLPPNAQILADSGYQGLQKIHPNTYIPIRKKRGKSYTKEEKSHNRRLSQERIIVEHKIGQMKVFRILKDTYRNQLQGYHVKTNIIAGIMNLRCAS